MSGERRLTPGQSETTLFPVVGERRGSVPPIGSWQLRIDGLVQRRLSLTFEEILGLPDVDRIWDTICVTGWTHIGHHWRGVLLSTLLDMADVSPHARFVRFVSYSPRNHDTSLPIDYAREHALLAFEVDGAPLSPEHGYPLRSVTTGRYFYKSVKWLARVELLQNDQPGYWERTSAYHNIADPVLQQRYDPRPMPVHEFQQRLAARDFRSAVAIADPQFAQLRGVDLSGARFDDAAIKGCTFSGVDMQSAACRGANFTRSRFLDANLRGADLSGTDLEGADFRGADLRDADLRGASLTATRFHARHRTTLMAGAYVLVRDIANDVLTQADREFLADPATGIIFTD